MFEAESTVTEKTKIQPKPFFSLKFRDHINLPENYDYEVEIVPDSYNSKQVLFYKTKNLNVTITDKIIVPEQRYIATVSLD